MPVNTSQVPGRRVLRFNSLDDLLRDVNHLADRGVPITMGNWTPGQILHHLSIVQKGAIDGLGFQGSFLSRLMASLFKKRILTKGMPAGFKMPKQLKSTSEKLPDWQDALAEFRESIDRLKQEIKREPHPFFGKLSNEEWEQLICRHGELHLSFLNPR